MLTFALYFLLTTAGISHVYSKGRNIFTYLETAAGHINSLWQDFDLFMQYFRLMTELREKKELYFLLEQRICSCLTKNIAF